MNAHCSYASSLLRPRMPGRIFQTHHIPLTGTQRLFSETKYTLLAIPVSSHLTPLTNVSQLFMNSRLSDLESTFLPRVVPCGFLMALVRLWNLTQRVHLPQNILLQGLIMPLEVRVFKLGTLSIICMSMETCTSLV